MWWKFGFALIAIAAAAVVAAVAQIASSGASDNCNGCDASPAWAEVVWMVSGVALVLWLAAVVVVAARAAVRAR